MKNKKAFTLIELLAVIVVLAVIALIAIPIINNVIDKAKQGALKDSAYGIINVAENYFAMNLKDGLDTDLKFNCIGNKCTSETREINYKGNIDIGTLLIYKNGEIEICITNDETSARKLKTDKEVQLEDGTCNDLEIVSASSETLKEITNAKQKLIDALNQKGITEDIPTTNDSLTTVVNRSVDEITNSNYFHYVYDPSKSINEINGMQKRHMSGYSTMNTTDQYIELDSTVWSDRSTDFATVNKVDFTNYNNLYIEFSNSSTNSFYIGIMNVNTTTSSNESMVSLIDNGNTYQAMGVNFNNTKELENGHKLMCINVSNIKTEAYVVFELYLRK